jgi:crossover junction endodeoxyribonuclease RuvC
MTDEILNCRVLAIDPGITNTGYAIIEKNDRKMKFIISGCVKTNDEILFQYKLAKIYRELIEIIKSYNPSCASIEGIFVSKNPKSALILGHARASAILAVEHSNLKLYEYSPTDVKQQLTGYGNADKNQIKYMVSQIFGAPVNNLKTYHESDALAIGLCHVYRLNYLNKFKV